MGASKRWVDNWLISTEIGIGGQGRVHLAREVKSGEWKALVDRVWQQANDLTPGRSVISPAGLSSLMLDAMLDAYEILAASRLGALKEIHSQVEQKVPETAKTRFEQEFRIAELIDDPSLIKILDANIEAGWYVMEYHKNGALDRNLNRFYGKVKCALTAIRPIVAVVSTLHSKGIVHRDIKPQNIFVANDGRLVLGDLGLAHDTAANTRPTATHENVGSWQWMPTWASAHRQKDVPKNFDTYCLAKTLWSMVSGKPHLPYHHYDDEEYDLIKQFPADPAMVQLDSIFKESIVSEKKMGVRDAAELLAKIDALVTVIAGSQHIVSERRAHQLFQGKWTIRKESRFDAIPDVTFSVNEHDDMIVGDRIVGRITVLESLSDTQHLIQKISTLGSPVSRENITFKDLRTAVGVDQVGNPCWYWKENEDN